jgi:predicted enzyme related to lactoylglutathione lyase
MSSAEQNQPGEIIWTDLTAKNATDIRDFYEAVVGWRSEPFDGDYNMFAPGIDSPVAGVCHALGGNADLPAQWLMYIVVSDLDASMQRCLELGGEVMGGVRSMGEQGRWCVIRDPAGAVAGLIETR